MPPDKLIREVEWLASFAPGELLDCPDLPLLLLASPEILPHVERARTSKAAAAFVLLARQTATRDQALCAVLRSAAEINEHLERPFPAREIYRVHAACAQHGAGVAGASLAAMRLKRETMLPRQTTEAEEREPAYRLRYALRQLLSVLATSGAADPTPLGDAVRLDSAQQCYTTVLNLAMAAERQDEPRLGRYLAELVSLVAPKTMDTGRAARHKVPSCSPPTVPDEARLRPPPHVAARRVR